jgi:hypothetical protein
MIQFCSGTADADIRGGATGDGPIWPCRANACIRSKTPYLSYSWSKPEFLMMARPAGWALPMAVNIV